MFLLVLCVGVVIAMQTIDGTKVELEKRPEAKSSLGLSITSKSGGDDSQDSPVFVKYEEPPLEIETRRESSKSEENLPVTDGSTEVIGEGVEMANAPITRMVKIEPNNNYIRYYNPKKISKDIQR